MIRLSDIIFECLKDYWFQGDDEKCFPSSAASYYNARASGNWDTICNTDYSTMDGDVPTYWRAMECGDDLHIGEFLINS